MSIELVFHEKYDATSVAETLMDNGYVVMLSRENDLYVLNAIWSANGADRNDVVFVPKDAVEAGEGDYDYAEG